MTTHSNSDKRPRVGVLLLAGALDLVATFLAFVVFREASPLYFLVGGLFTIGVLIAGAFGPPLFLYLFTFGAFIRAITQLPLHPLDERLPIFAADLAAAALALSYIVARRRMARRQA